MYSQFLTFSDHSEVHKSVYQTRQALAFGVDPGRRERFSLRQARYYAIGWIMPKVVSTWPS